MNYVAAVSAFGNQFVPSGAAGVPASARQGEWSCDICAPTSMNYRFRRGKYVLLMDNHHATHAFDANSGFSPRGLKRGSVPDGVLPAQIARAARSWATSQMACRVEHARRRGIVNPSRSVDTSHFSRPQTFKKKMQRCDACTRVMYRARI